MPSRAVGRLRAPGPGQDSGLPRGPTPEQRVETFRELLREQVSHDDDSLCQPVVTGHLPYSREWPGYPLAGSQWSPKAVALVRSGQYAEEDMEVAWISNETWVT